MLQKMVCDGTERVRLDYDRVNGVDKESRTYRNLIIGAGPCVYTDKITPILSKKIPEFCLLP